MLTSIALSYFNNGDWGINWSYSHRQLNTSKKWCVYFFWLCRLYHIRSHVRSEWGREIICFMYSASRSLQVKNPLKLFEGYVGWLLQGEISVPTHMIPSITYSIDTLSTWIQVDLYYTNSLLHLLPFVFVLKHAWYICHYN